MERLTPSVELDLECRGKRRLGRARPDNPWLSRPHLVALPGDAPWRADFVKEMGDFPVGQHDDVPDAFCHGMKSFTTARDFKTPDLPVMPGHLQSEYEANEARRQELFEEWQYENDTRIGGDFGDDF